jgi:plasmid maintenance system antidote protein VapI
MRTSVQAEGGVSHHNTGASSVPPLARRLRAAIDATYSKHTYIAECLGVPRCELSKMLAGERAIMPHHIEKLPREVRCALAEVNEVVTGRAVVDLTHDAAVRQLVHGYFALRGGAK